MAMKTKQELKDVFSGLSSIMLVKGGIADFATVTPDFDLPVTVDTLSLSQAEPTLNRTKVHGLPPVQQEILLSLLPFQV